MTEKPAGELAGKITTHALDTSIGRPAAGLLVRLSARSGDGSSVLLKEDRTNADGRLEEPIYAGDLTESGEYELEFEAGRYFRDRLGTERPLFDTISVRFRPADARGHYHIPLLLAPGGYSTYRGS